MSERGRMLLLSIAILVTVSLSVTVLAVGMLYGATFEQHSDRLTRMVRHRARSLDAVAEYETELHEEAILRVSRPSLRKGRNGKEHGRRVHRERLRRNPPLIGSAPQEAGRSGCQLQHGGAARFESPEEWPEEHGGGSRPTRQAGAPTFAESSNAGSGGTAPRRRSKESSNVVW